MSGCTFKKSIGIQICVKQKTLEALPTPRLLRMYKNCAKQSTGLVPEKLKCLILRRAEKLGYQCWWTVS